VRLGPFASCGARWFGSIHKRKGLSGRGRFSFDGVDSSLTSYVCDVLAIIRPTPNADVGRPTLGNAQCSTECNPDALEMLDIHRPGCLALGPTLIRRILYREGPDARQSFLFIHYSHATNLIAASLSNSERQRLSARLCSCGGKTEGL